MYTMIKSFPAIFLTTNISGLETGKQRGSPTSAGQAACLRAHDDQHQEQPRLDQQDVQHDDQHDVQQDDQHQEQPCLDQQDVEHVDQLDDQHQEQPR